jgi:hypothetical protein
MNIVKDDSVGDGNVIFDNGLRTWINVDNRIILDAGTVADDDRPEIRANGYTRGDQTFMAYADITDQSSVRMNEGIERDLRFFAFEFI